MFREFLASLIEASPCFLITFLPLYMYAGILLFFGLLFTSYWYLSLLYVAWYFYDRETPFRNGRRLPFLRNFFIWRYLGRYFPTKLHKTADLDPSKNYLFAGHPHGLAAFGGMLSFGTNALGFDEMFPGITVHLLTVAYVYKIPLVREIFMAIGGGTVTADSVDYKLTKMGPGHSAFIAIGGGVEVRLSDHRTYTLKLKTRKGFIRRALKTGASVVPVFTFNEHRTYDIPQIIKGTFPYYYDQLTKLFINNAFPINVYGRWQWTGPLVPKKVPLDTVIGAPIDFAKMNSFRPGQEPSDGLVDECHAIYMEAYRKLYDDHKARFGDENTPLIFV